MRLLFSVLMFGTKSFPACNIAQSTNGESNSLVKNREKGVGEGTRVGVGAGVSVTGMGVGGNVAVGDGKGAGVEVAVWQPVMRIMHPIRINFFMMLIKTQLSGALFQTIVFKRRDKLNNQSQRIPLRQ